jgi:starvation-inducible outer membrane lipoprotein
MDWTSGLRDTQKPMRRKLFILASGMTFWLSVAACDGPMFPPAVTRNVSPEFDFKAWKQGVYDTSPQAGRLLGTVQLGGDIFDVQQKSDATVIIGDNLPIVERPKYGPKKVKRTSDASFAIELQKITDATWLQRGNFFIVIGKPSGMKNVVVDDMPRNEPYLVADCIHIWKNQGRDIASFPFETGAGYYPLEENTFCHSSTQ